MIDSIVEELTQRFGKPGERGIVATQETCDQIPTVWVKRGSLIEILTYLKRDNERPYKMLYDITAIDERHRKFRDGQPASDFTVLYQLLSFDRNRDIRLKVALEEGDLSVPSICALWENANWYEREVWDMFGISFDGHPHLRRILMPQTWKGHPLRKDHPARATEMGPFVMTDEYEDANHEALTFVPEEWGMQRQTEDSDFIFLNLGPQHPGTHGVLRIVLQLDGEEILDSVADIGYHHRGAEKMAERQSWHTFIPYTDRIDYLAGVMNNMAYLLTIEKMLNIEVPPRAQCIRIMMCELFRIASHLVWYGTYVQDIGVMSPTFFLFNDRERVFKIVEAVCGDRMHPNWFRIGGVAQDLPNGWQELFVDFLEYLPKRLTEYDKTVMKNRIFKARTKGVGAFDIDSAIEWGVTGPGLRACGFDWDLRKKRPYGGYDQFDFDIPIAHHGDCYDRGLVRIEEMRQSLRIIEQCIKHMPDGPYKSSHPATTPPLKEHTMKDIETLINHFLNVSWGPVIPPNECFHDIEGTKGSNGYYLISDGSTGSYRTRVRTPSFAHMQMLPEMVRGWMIPDLMAVVGAMDYVLADIDR